MKTLMTLLIPMSISLAAHAASEVDGSWKIQRNECLSGAPYQEVTSPGVHSSLESGMLIKDGHLGAKLTFTQKWDADIANQAIVSVNKTIVQINQQPNSPLKVIELTQAEKSLKTIQQFADGLTCIATEEAAVSFDVNKRTLNVSNAIVRSSCPSAEALTGPGADSTLGVVLHGDVLKLISSKEETTSDHCPIGDHAVAVLQKQ